MTCGHCGASNPDGARFCQSCGKSVGPGPRTCPACGTINSESAAFCSNCGSGLDPKASSPGAEPDLSVRADAQTQSGSSQPPPVPRSSPPPLARPAAPSTGSHKVAALCIWVVAIILVLLGFASGVSMDEINDCIQRGGSGTTCASTTLLSKMFFVMAFFTAALGARYWVKK
jgi:uncharacterized membrane protein YvbJ